MAAPRIASLFAFSLALLPLRASAEEADQRRYEVEYFGTDEPERPMLFCLLLPYENCRHTFDLAIEYGGGMNYGQGLQARAGEENDSLQLQVDGVYLGQVLERPSIQVGPMLGFEAERYHDLWRFRLLAAARGRIWAGRWITVDAALGGVASFDDRWGYRGLGGLSELAVTLHGHLGAYLQVQVLDGPGGVETRVTAGFRGSFTAWAVIFAGLM